MSLNLYLIRHAASTLNSKSIFQPPNTPLSSTVKHQAHKHFSHLINIKFKSLYSSNLTRAQQTAQIIANQYRLTTNHLSILQEWRKPSQLEGLAFDNPEAKRIIRALQSHRDNPDFIFSDDESFRQFTNRAQQVLDFFENHQSEQSIIAVSHAHLIRAIILKLLLGKHLNQVKYWQLTSVLVHSHLGITHLRLSPPNNWQIISWNSHVYQ